MPTGLEWCETVKVTEKEQMGSNYASVLALPKLASEVGTPTRSGQGPRRFREGREQSFDATLEGGRLSLHAFFKHRSGTNALQALMPFRCSSLSSSLWSC